MSAASVLVRLMKVNPRFVLYRQRKATTAALSHVAQSAKLPHIGNKVLFSSCPQPLRSEEKVTVHFINRNGGKLTTSGAVGDSLLDVVVKQSLDIDGFGACEGTLACSTCHVILDQEVYDSLGSIVDEEMDMLDLALGLTETSRLGCQVCLSRPLEGMTARVPETFNDMRSGDDTSTSSSS